MIKSKTKTRSKGKEPAYMTTIAKRLRGSMVTVGVQSDCDRENGESRTYPDNGPTVAEVAAWNEYGTSNAPERSFLRSAVHENDARIFEWRRHALEKMSEDEWTAEKALTFMGFNIAQLIVNKIKSNVPPPNAPATVAAKKAKGNADRTLIDTTLLMRSIGFRVKVGGEGGGHGGGHE